MVGHVTPEAAEGPGNIFFCWYLLVGCWMLVGCWLGVGALFMFDVLLT
jgi:hypothetical protein